MACFGRDCYRAVAAGRQAGELVSQPQQHTYMRYCSTAFNIILVLSFPDSGKKVKFHSRCVICSSILDVRDFWTSVCLSVTQ